MYYPGQKYRPSAARENEIDRLLRDARAGSVSYESADPSRMPLGHMMAKNTTGADLGFGKAAMYYNNKYRHTGVWADWDMRNDFLLLSALTDVLSTPGIDEQIGGLAITLEPIADNQFGRVAISGLALLGYVPEVSTFAARDSHFLQPTAGNNLVFSYWGFGRVLVWQVANQFTGNMSLVNLSDRKFQVQYVLTANMGASATATLGNGGGTTWTTTVHDVHNIASFQRTGDKGFAEWRGYRWVVTVPFCT